MNRFIVAFIGATTAMLTTDAALAAAPAGQSKQFVSPVYTIDKIYHSMEGPSSMERIYLGDPNGTAELFWVTGIRTEMVAADGSTPQLPELMCHVNVDLDPDRHQALFGFRRATAARLMTLSQGMLAARLPAGFGFPMASNEPLLLFTQVLNLNIQHPQDLKVRHRVTIDYVRDRDLTSPIKPLFNVGASGMVQVDDNPLAHSMASMPSTSSITTAAGHAGTTMNPTMSCLAGARAPQATSGSADYVDPQGRKMTGHWIVPPGKQVNHSDITWFMNLQFDTRLHYAAVHLHPFARSLEMRDSTTGQTVFLAKAENPQDSVGLLHVDEFSSAEGVPLLHNHQYSLISTYDNPTDTNADSMASVFLGLDDLELTVPPPHRLAQASSALFDSSTLVLHTNIGTITAALGRDRAPETVIQVARFVLAGALDSTHLIVQKNAAIAVSLPIDRTAMLLQPTRVEGGVERKLGTVTYCRPGGARSEATIVIDMAQPKARDTSCVGFARIVKGIDLLVAFTPGTSASLVKAETVRNPAPATKIVAAK